MGLRGRNAKPKAQSKAATLAKLVRAPARRRRAAARKAPAKLSRAERVIRFIERLKITTGPHAGENFSVRLWQREILEATYAVDGNGKRQKRFVLLSTPRKQGKTGLAAALALCHLCGPEAEQRGQVYSAAADREQAAILFREMEAIIQADPALTARCNIQRFAKKIEDLETGSVYSALSADARKAHGLAPSFVVFDELAQSPSRELFDNLRTGSRARAEPLFVVISTQSSDPLHVMSQLVDHGQAVLAGTVNDPTFLPVIYAAPADADPWDEKVWAACNPALGDFCSLEEMRIEAERAQRMPSQENAFRNLYLNQRVDATAHLLAPADWAACGEAVDPEELRGADCWGGLDLSLRQDLTALELFFPESGAVLSWAWLPEEGLAQKAVLDRAPYLDWKRLRVLETTPGRVVDTRFVARRCAEILAAFNVLGIAYDRWRIEEFKKTLADEGIDLPLIAHGQGFRDMAPAVDALEAAILDKKLKHGMHPVLTWCAGHAVAETDPAGNRKITKQASRGRVDSLVALCMALGVAAQKTAAPAEPDMNAIILARGGFA